ncbi:MAG: hypothetical protein J6T10_02600 [Methanobrevibacter sp.]|nr:hypothetical protein [Methanobrevibacter sp.]
MTNTKYVRDELRKTNEGKLKLNSLYGQMVKEYYKSENTHCKMEGLNNDKSQKK